MGGREGAPARSAAVWQRADSSATLGMATKDWKCPASCCTASISCAHSAYSFRSTALCS